MQTSIQNALHFFFSKLLINYETCVLDVFKNVYFIWDLGRSSCCFGGLFGPILLCLPKITPEDVHGFQINIRNELKTSQGFQKCIILMGIICWKSLVTVLVVFGAFLALIGSIWPSWYPKVPNNYQNWIVDTMGLKKCIVHIGIGCLESLVTVLAVFGAYLALFGPIWPSWYTKVQNKYQNWIVDIMRFPKMYHMYRFDAII